MRYYKVLNEDGTLNRIGTGNDGEKITKEEFDTILSEIISKSTELVDDVVYEYPTEPTIKDRLEALESAVEMLVETLE